jgi:hypothetical protein
MIMDIFDMRHPIVLNAALKYLCRLKAKKSAILAKVISFDCSIQQRCNDSSTQHKPDLK